MLFLSMIRRQSQLRSMHLIMQNFQGFDKSSSIVRSAMHFSMQMSVKLFSNSISTCPDLLKGVIFGRFALDRILIIRIIIINSSFYLFYHIYFESVHMDQGQAVFYEISKSKYTYEFKQVHPEDLYNNQGNGFVRRAIKTKQTQPYEKRFQDREFKLEKSDKYKIARLYDFFQSEVPLFPPNEQEPSFIEEQPSYNSFIGESGIISYDYLQSLFFTQTVNQAGYYQYFVKRDGEYFIQQCDDTIPVDRKTWKPLWGLSQKHPWQILLLKTWLKQCGSWSAMQKAAPFRFLESFGLPSYRTFNFRKEMRFIKNERLPAEKKQENIKQYTLNKKETIILAQTADDRDLLKVGLVPNSAAYRMERVGEDSQGEGIFRVFSSLPCGWVGTFTAVQETKLNKMYQNNDLDLERNFIMSEREVLNYFNKFYVAPQIFSNVDSLMIQDCINLTATKSKPIWLRFSGKNRQEGLCSISIQLPKKSGANSRYPEMRYFLSKKNTEDEISRSHFREDIRGSEKDGNMYIESNCDKWEEYRIDYVQGYHNTATFFTKLVEGWYMLYINIDENTPFRVRFDSQVPISKPEVDTPDAKLEKEIFDSTFFNISQEMGVEASFNKNTFDESITLNNAFEELGFGSICIKTLAKAQHKVAMRVFPDKLKEKGLDLCSHYYDGYDADGKSKNFVLVSEKGRPEIIVMERISQRNKSEIGEVFPPEGTIEFFKIIPDGTRSANQKSSYKEKQKSKSKSKVKKSKH